MPSKKVLSFLIVIVALVVSILIAFGRDKSSTAINFASELVAGEKVNLPENPEWQSELGRLGLPEAPKESTEQTSDLKGEEETATDTISRTLMANYIELKQTGNLNQESAQELIDRTANYVSLSGSQAAKITQVNIVPDNGQVSIAQYGDNLGYILKNNRPLNPKNELEILTQALNTKNESSLEELDGVIVVYEKITEDLIKMPVPKTFVKAHLDVVNGINGMAISLKNIKTVFKDPIVALSAVNTYQEGAAISTRAIEAIKNFISQSKIIYKQGSGGYYLIYGI